MTDEGARGRFELLPDHPEEFFGLPGTFERKYLKRAYNDLIRVYRPETHPEEFIKVRAAYEARDRKLRLAGARGPEPLEADAALPGEPCPFPRPRPARRVYVAPAAERLPFAELLLRLASRVDSRSFFGVTEPLWIRVLDSVPFADFRKTLEACEAAVRPEGRQDHTAFLLRILRLAMFRADEAWLRDRLDQAERSFESLSPEQEDSLEVLLRLYRYRARREQFLRGEYLRSVLDRVLIGYCELDDAGFRSLFLAAQARVLESESALLSGLPPETPALADFAEAYLWIAHEMQARLARTSAGGSAAFTDRQVAELLTAMGRDALKGIPGVVDLLFRFRALALIGVVFVFPLFFSRMLERLYVPTLPCFAVWALLVFIIGGSVELHLGRLTETRERWVARYAYTRRWRKPLVAFLRAHDLTPASFRDILADYRLQDIWITRWLSSCSEPDRALDILLAAHRFAGDPGGASH